MNSENIVGDTLILTPPPPLTSNLNLKASMPQPKIATIILSISRLQK